MIPILFEYNTEYPDGFKSHGIGDLIDCIECKVRQNEDGEYELSFSYPMTGYLLNELTIGRLIYAKANSWQQNQIFRIYGYEKVIAGTITVNCQHISYDLCNAPVKAFKAGKDDNANKVLTGDSNSIKKNIVSISGLNLSSKFTFSSDVTGKAQREKGYFEVETPTSVRAALLDGDDSVKGCFGGDLIFDNYTVTLAKTGGQDRGVVIEYGIDLMDLQQEHNISEMYTGVYPFYTYNNKNNNQVVTYGDIQYAKNVPAEYKMHRIFPLDLTSYFPNQAENSAPDKKDLNSKAEEWMKKEDNFGQPEINLTISYAALGQDVQLYDAVTVRFPKLGIDVKTKVCGYTYDVLRERMEEVEVGKTKPSAVFSLEDASRLRKGLMPPERIKNNSIGGGKISGGGVSSYHLKNKAATRDKIDDKAVDTPQLEDEAVTYGKSEYQETLDQVGINEGNIEALQDIVVGHAQATSINAKNLIWENASAGYLGISTISAATIYCSNIVGS